MSAGSIIRNILAVIGAIALVAVVVVWLQVRSFTDRLDSGAMEMFGRVGGTYLETLDPGVSVVKTVQVEEGLSPQDVADSLKSLAVQHGMLFVGESPFYKQVEAVTGEPYRFVSFYSFCDARVGAEMIAYNSAYSAFMPCRIALVEDEQGGLSLHMLNLDMFIYGGKPLPLEVKKGAIMVRDALDQMLVGAARGEF